MKKTILLVFLFYGLVMGLFALVNLKPEFVAAMPTFIEKPLSLISINAIFKGSLNQESVKYMTYFVLFGTAVFILFVIAKSFENSSGTDYSNRDNHGTAKIASVDELKVLLGATGFIITKHIRLALKFSFEHLGLIGPTGSGKSSSFYIPNALDLDGKTSAIFTDPKGEIKWICEHYLRKKGYNIMTINPFKPQMRYNPILTAETSKDMNEVAQLILMNGIKSYEIASGSSGNNSEWLQMAQPLLTSVMLYVKKFGKRKDIIEVLDIILKDNFEELKKKCTMDQEMERYFLIFASSGGSEKTMSSIKITLNANLQLFSDSTIQEFISTPFVEKVVDGKTERVIDKRKIFNAKELRTHPTIVFVSVPEDDSIYMMPLMAVFYKQLLSELLRTKGIPVLAFLDEFANIGIIPGIATVAATARSRQIGLALGLQGMEQLVRNYGEQNAADLLNNLKTKVVLSGLSGESAEYVSKLSGYTTIKTESVQKKGEGFSLFAVDDRTLGAQQRQLLTSDEVRRLDDDKAIIIAHNKNLVIDEKVAYYKEKKYRKRIPKEILEQLDEMNKKVS